MTALSRLTDVFLSDDGHLFCPAMCELDKARSSRLRRMSGKRAATATFRTEVERQERAVPVGDKESLEGDMLQPF